MRDRTDEGHASSQRLGIGLKFGPSLAASYDQEADLLSRPVHGSHTVDEEAEAIDLPSAATVGKPGGRKQHDSSVRNGHPLAHPRAHRHVAAELRCGDSGTHQRELAAKPAVSVKAVLIAGFGDDDLIGRTQRELVQENAGEARLASAGRGAALHRPIENIARSQTVREQGSGDIRRNAVAVVSHPDVGAKRTCRATDPSKRPWYAQRRTPAAERGFGAEIRQDADVMALPLEGGDQVASDHHIAGRLGVR